MLKVFESAEVLPVRVLQKAGNHRFVAFVKRVLQIMQTDHQARGQTWSEVLNEQSAEVVLEYLPVDTIGKYK